MLNGTAQKHVGASLVELGTQLAVVYVKLKERMAWGQRNLVGFERVPAANDQSAALWVCLDLVDEVCELVRAVAVVFTRLIFGGSEVSPLVAVHRAEVSCFSTEASSVFCGGPFIPNLHADFLQMADVGLASHEP